MPWLTLLYFGELLANIVANLISCHFAVKLMEINGPAPPRLSISISFTAKLQLIRLATKLATNLVKYNNIGLIGGPIVPVIALIRTGVWALPAAPGPCFVSFQLWKGSGLLPFRY